MKTRNRISKCRPPHFLLAGISILLVACSGDQVSWAKRNQQVIEQYKVTGRTRDLPPLSVPTAFTDGLPVERAALPVITLAPGVTATLGWGRGALLERLEMQAETSYPDQKLDEELFIIVQDGSATIDVDGKSLSIAKDQALYLQPGSVRSMKAGAKGLLAFEAYSPVRLDHLALAGQKTDGASATFPDLGVTPSLQPGVVVDLEDIQWTPLTNPMPDVSYRHSNTNARLLWGRNAQISLVRIDPQSEIAKHIHPEDQLTTTVRGSIAQGVMDQTYDSTGAAGHLVFLPGGMVHSGLAGELGVDQLDVFWPVRPDYVERAAKQRALYEEVIAPGDKPVKLAEGFTFAEGPTWLKGRLYFSDMWFKDHVAGDWTGSPERSRLIVMEPDGRYRVLARGMQSNGTIAARNGNLIVCDMFGHRVVEVDPANGRVVRVLLDRIEGKPIDGPNDLVMDAKGGLYITDPQFTPEATKSQPGKQVYYLAPDGKARVVIGPGEFAMPNGVELSPDGKTLYVNNTWEQPGGNFVWAYDVAEDGSLSNKRQFAHIALTADVLGAKDPAGRFSSGADGTAVDIDGRYYVATTAGVQIFLPDGTAAGTIRVPETPVSLTFGGPDNDILYIVGGSSAWSIRTKVRGFRHPANGVQ